MQTPFTWWFPIPVSFHYLRSTDNYNTAIFLVHSSFEKQLKSLVTFKAYHDIKIKYFLLSN